MAVYYVTAEEARAEAHKRGWARNYMRSLDTIMRKLARAETQVVLLRADDGVRVFTCKPDGRIVVRTFAPRSSIAEFHWRARLATRA